MDQSDFVLQGVWAVDTQQGHKTEKDQEKSS